MNYAPGIGYIALSRHVTRGLAERRVRCHEARGEFPSYVLRAVRKGRWCWEVVAVLRMTLDFDAPSAAEKARRK